MQAGSPFQNNHEKDRIAQVKRYLSLEEDSRKQLKDIVKLAAQICDAPLSMITCVDEDLQIFLASYGTELIQTTRDTSFCTHTIEQDELLIVNHADRNPLFSENPFVVGDPYIRFYAGMPLKVNNEFNIGSLCVLDKKPKTLTPLQEESLKILTKQVVLILELRQSVAQLQTQKEEIERSRIELQSIYDSGQNFHFLLDRQMKLLTFNQAIKTFIKEAHNEELEVGHVFTEYIHNQKQDEFLECFVRALDGDVIHEEQEIFFKSRDQRSWWDITYAPVRNVHHTIIGVAYTAIDIHEKKIQRDKLMLQNQRLNTIAEIQSHQIRKPVASIIGILDLIKLDKYSFNEEYLTLLDLSVKELDEKINRIVN